MTEKSVTHIKAQIISTSKAKIQMNIPWVLVCCREIGLANQKLKAVSGPLETRKLTYFNLSEIEAFMALATNGPKELNNSLVESFVTRK